MYEIFSDNVLLYAPYLKAEDKKILNPKWVMELGKAGELTFIAPPESPLYLGQNTNDGETRYDKLTSTIWIRKTLNNNTKIIWSGRVLHEDKDFNGNKDVYCEGRLAYLNDGICFPYRFGYPKKPAYIDRTRYCADRVFPASYESPDSEGRPRAGLIPNYIRLFNVHQQANKQFQIGTLNVEALDHDPNGYSFGSDEFNSFYDEMTEKLINDPNFGGYFSVSYGGTTIDENNKLDAYFNYLHYEDGSNDDAPHSNQVIRFGENLLDITEYVDTENIFTIITPLGKTTTNYIYKRDESIVNVINENNKKAILWAWLVNKDSDVAAKYKSSPSAESPPKEDDFINNEFPKSETGPRIDITSVNITGNGSPYKYMPRPDQWDSDSYNVKKYGSIERTMVFDDVEDPSKLLELGEIYLGLIGLIDTISITAADLSVIDVNADEIELGDMVTIESVPHGIFAKLQCRKIELDFENPMSTVFTFGSTVSGLTDKQLDTAKQTLKNTERVNSTEQNLINKIDAIDSDGLTNYAKKSELLALQTETNNTLASINNTLASIRQLPSVTNIDDGKILKVVNGAWQLVVDSGGGSTN